jgi:hypothetical protein
MDVTVSCGQFAARMAKDVDEALRHVAKDVFNSDDPQRDILRGLARRVEGQAGQRELTLSGSERELAEAVKAVEHVVREVFEDGDPQHRSLTAFAAGLRRALEVAPPPKPDVRLSADEEASILRVARAYAEVYRERDALAHEDTLKIAGPLKRSGNPLLAIEVEEALTRNSRVRSVIGLSMRDWWPARREEVRGLRLGRAERTVRPTIPADIAELVAEHNAAWSAVEGRIAALEPEKERAVAALRRLTDADAVDKFRERLPGGARPVTPSPIHIACANHADDIRRADAEAKTSPSLRRR